MATLYNAHFDAKGVPWTPDDIMGKGDREKRRMERSASRVKAGVRNGLMGRAGSSDIPDFFIKLGERKGVKPSGRSAASAGVKPRGRKR